MKRVVARESEVYDTLERRYGIYYMFDSGLGRRVVSLGGGMAGEYDWGWLLLADGNVLYTYCVPIDGDWGILRKVAGL